MSGGKPQCSSDHCRESICAWLREVRHPAGLIAPSFSEMVKQVWHGAPDLHTQHMQDYGAVHGALTAALQAANRHRKGPRQGGAPSSAAPHSCTSTCRSRSSSRWAGAG